VTWGVVTGTLAESAMSDGIAAAQGGRPIAAEHDFDRALTLNPQLRYNSQLDTELGQVQANQGQQSALAWLAKAANPPTTEDGIAQQLLDYSQAASMAPRNPVIQDGFAVALADDMIGTEAPVDPRAVSRLGGMAFLSFTYGHFAYEAGDDSATIRFMRQTVAHTENGELLSLAYTYLGLSEERLGHLPAFRRDIVNAVNLDTQDVNALGREVAAGLYTPGPP
jgi:tetratricopeptide (TPR) repeat protein